MARSIRIQYPGAFYHVMARGNRREAIFLDDDDRRFFLKAVGEACERTGWRLHAWVLMGNHYHLLVETPEANLVAGMQWLQNTFTRRFNVRHRQWGKLFGDRYKAVLVEGGGGYYYQTLLDYIHLNPVRAGLVRLSAGQNVLDYPWSSLGGYVASVRQRPRWLEAEVGLGAFDCADTVAGRRKFLERLEHRAVEEDPRQAGVPKAVGEVDRRCSDLRRGWYWGTQAFAEKMLATAEQALRRPRGRAYRSGEVRRAKDLGQAERWVKEGLAAAGLKEGDLALLPGSDARKVALAGLIWKRTIVSQGWIAERLAMKSAANVSQQLRRRGGRNKPLPDGLRRFLKAQVESIFEP